MATVIVKIVGNECNLRCNYCFYNTTDQSVKTIMNFDLLGKMIQDVISYSRENAVFIWHGGEPLLAGLDFFEQIIEFQQKYNRFGKSIRNSIQTNGTLIDDNWARMFLKHRFRIGISLDGCKETHNKFRRYPYGGGSFDDVIRGINILREHGVSSGFIQTVSRKNLETIEEDFHFFVDDLKIKSWGINPILDVNEKNENLRAQYLKPSELTFFLKRLIELWLGENNEYLKIREIDDFIAGVLGKRANLCIFNGGCPKYACIDFNGDVYPCDRFSNKKDFYLGNIGSETIGTILNSDRHRAYEKEVTNYSANCLKCQWFHACHNGCPHHRVERLCGKYYYCSTRKEIFQFLHEKIYRERG